MGGSGGGAMAIQEMVRQMRKLRLASEARREYRLARRRQRRQGHDPEEGQQREDFECYTLCSSCGFLGDGRGRCPSCGETTWFDLGDVSIAYRLRDIEQEDRAQAPPWVRRVTIALALISAALVMTGLYLIYGLNPIILLGVSAGLVVFFFGQRPLAWLLLRLGPKHAHRWRHPALPRARARSREVSGRVEALGEALRAPLSGRACLAYRVAVLFDTAGDARPPEWVLDETHGADLIIGEERVAGESVMLQNGLEELGRQDLGEVDLETFLRKRGLHLSDGEFWLFEAVLEPGELASAALYGNGTCALRSARFDDALKDARAGRLALPSVGGAGLLATAGQEGAVALVTDER